MERKQWEEAPERQRERERKILWFFKLSSLWLLFNDASNCTNSFATFPRISSTTISLANSFFILSLFTLTNEFGVFFYFVNLNHIAVICAYNQKHIGQMHCTYENEYCNYYTFINEYIRNYSKYEWPPKRDIDGKTFNFHTSILGCTDFEWIFLFYVPCDYWPLLLFIVWCHCLYLYVTENVLTRISDRSLHIRNLMTW